MKTQHFGILTVTLMISLSAWRADALVLPGCEPGVATFTQQNGQITLQNQIIAGSWALDSGHLVPGALKEKQMGQVLSAPDEAFILELRDGRMIQSSDMTVTGTLQELTLPGNPAAAKLADRLPGRAVSATLVSSDGTVSVAWRAMLGDGANYIRQQITIHPSNSLDIAKVILIDQRLPAGTEVCGTVAGSPVVAGTVFMAVEHPMAVAQVKLGRFGETQTVPAPDANEDADDEGHFPKTTPLQHSWGRHRARCWLELALPIKAGAMFTCSAVTGVTPPGQLRRSFLYYTERERAHPYRTFLHYNSWYDIGYFTPFNESDCLDAIRGFTRELGEKRGVIMDSFLFDDGWDDKTRGGEWRFHQGFPNGFTPLKEEAAKCGAAPGIWLSPWGGYEAPRAQRVASGMAAGFETDGSTNHPLFALSGPRYYKAFHQACVDLVTKYGINQFKFDGTGNINSVVPGSQFGSDFEAAIALIQDLRVIKPDLFINLTTGTWPSPFWLPICDSIWRGGWDHSYYGVGSARQRWMTFRDADTYERIVRRGPLFPLSSLMLHGIIYSKHAGKLSTDPENDFRDEVRSYFGTGTQLQEMYISHGLLSETNWNDLAQCATWARSNAEVLVDTHWIGGNPRNREIYGWASWTPKKGIITLRNPDENHQTCTFDLAKFLELPPGAPTSYTLTAPFKQRKEAKLTGTCNAEVPIQFTMRPFEVLVFEVMPQ